MTTITATSILASQHADAPQRVDTLLLRYPWIIHSEGQTHRLLEIGEDMEVLIKTPSLMADRDLSRNAGSTRAIPVEKMIQSVIDDPYVPLYWGKNQRGMQAGEELSPAEIEEARGLWLEAMANAIKSARRLDAMGIHKQQINRLLAPFSHITVVVTATEWVNFFALRDHADAEPHIRLLAQAIRVARDEATVQTLGPGEWHLPFADANTDDADNEDVFAAYKHIGAVSPKEGWECAIDNSWSNTQKVGELLLKLSVARCASTSYKTVEGFDMSLGRAIALHDKLVGSKPMHASPMEHQCYADEFIKRAKKWRQPNLHGNFRGFCQYRRALEVGA